ncbi:hypothetical protein C2L64_41785 [Paraburkholderia hospita]|uniref:Uncharacterized protein n=1 Tax=Paraburkholderia hospita TaxID=169430 RepID=A0AAN1JIN3_9BURK|nr:hypothetical protein C2L64_41785 [Paraburkholderia hospita]
MNTIRSVLSQVDRVEVGEEGMAGDVSSDCLVIFTKGVEFGTIAQPLGKVVSEVSLDRGYAVGPLAARRICMTKRRVAQQACHSFAHAVAQLFVKSRFDRGGRPRAG